EKRPDGTPVYTPRVCLSLMVFYVFAMQCLSTVAVVKRETNGWKWPLFQFAYMTLTAAMASLLVYQVGGWLGFA
ncbi:MAG: ferrous iron transport protein B, partial [Verrucomicrobiota bacterium]|nr:ferrous iron transport protein B [Verrucomicrobiota bacterium]